jgi:hypothetical protein
VEAWRVACGDGTRVPGAQERGLTFVIRMCRLSLSHPSPSISARYMARVVRRDRVANALSAEKDKDMVGRQPAETDGLIALLLRLYNDRRYKYYLP